MASTGRNTFTPLRMTVTDTIFTELTLARQLSVKHCYTEFHENPTNGLVANTTSWSQTGRTDVVCT